MKTSNLYQPNYFTLRNIPEKHILQKIYSLSKDLHNETDFTNQLLKKAQREYYLQELVRRDETPLP